MVYKVLQRLKSNKAAAEYGLSAEHLKYACGPVIKVITKLANQITETGCCPDILKKGIVTSVSRKRSAAKAQITIVESQLQQ